MTTDLVTHSDIKLLRDQIDQLQVAAAEPRKPWYRQRPSMLSLLAMIFSIVSFVIVQQRASLQEIRGKKEELRKLLIEMISFQDAFNNNVSTIADPRQREFASSQLNAKLVIYLQAATSLADDLTGQLSSAEYISLAYQSTGQSDFNKAEQYYLKAPDAARDIIAKATATRALGSFYCNTTPLKDLAKARLHFARAADITKASTDDYSNYATGYTFETWGLMEKFNGFHTDGNAKIEMARECYRKIQLPNTLGQWALEAMDKRIAMLPR